MGYCNRDRRKRLTIFVELNNDPVLSLFIGEITARISFKHGNVFGGRSLLLFGVTYS
jgi:hypothetical protein